MQWRQFEQGIELVDNNGETILELYPHYDHDDEMWMIKAEIILNGNNITVSACKNDVHEALRTFLAITRFWLVQ